MERLDKLLSHQGFGSRKDIRRLLRTAVVTLNGTRIFDPGAQVNPSSDEISINGEKITLQQHLYVMMNKIAGTVSTSRDGEHQTVFDLLDDGLRTPYLAEKLHIVGRLDLDTEGFLLLTTDGALTHRLISPKTVVNKTYFCILEKAETDSHKKEIERLFAQGIPVAAEDNEPPFTCKSAEVQWATAEQVAEFTGNSSYQLPEPLPEAALLTIHEGKHHQVKRMFAAVGNKVVFLKRLSIGAQKLDPALAPGEYRLMEPHEVENLEK